MIGCFYRELAFFVEDGIYHEFNESLNLLVYAYMQSMQDMGHPIEERFCRDLFASMTVQIKNRDEIWQSLLAMEKFISGRIENHRSHFITLAEVLDYCGSMYRLMWDEWVAIVTLFEFQKKNNLA